MKKFKFTTKTAFALSALLCAVLLVGCSAETKTEINNWWNMCISDMTNGDLFMTVLFGSLIGGWWSK